MVTLNTYVLEVDWEDDDTTADAAFTGDHDDITIRVFDCQCVRGRDYASQLTGRAVAGRLQATLDNADGFFSSFNASSPIAGLQLPGRKVRLRSTAPTAAVLWTGYLDRIEPRAGALPTAALYASGPLIKLGGPNARVSPEAQAFVQTGTAVEAVLDAAGWPAGDRDIDAGDVEIGHWYPDEAEALGLLQELEDTEQGFLGEGVAWDVVFKARYDRFLNHGSSVATFSDAPAATNPYLLGIVQEDPLREIFNEFEATVQPHELGSSAVLWTLSGEQPTIPPGGSITFIAKATSVDGRQVAYVDGWDTPVVGTDILQTGVSNGDLAVTVSPTALTLFITVENNHVSATAQLTSAQATGVPVYKLNPYKIVESDSASQLKYGKRTYPLPSRWYGNTAFAQGTAQYVLDRHAEPRPILSLPLPSGTDDDLFDLAVTLDLSDRITVEAEAMLTMLGIDEEFFIESIAHRWGARAPLETTFLLSPAPADPGWWILGVSELGVDTKLAY